MKRKRWWLLVGGPWVLVSVREELRSEALVLVGYL